jgi:hypothetical protein
LRFCSVDFEWQKANGCPFSYAICSLFCFARRASLFVGGCGKGKEKFVFFLHFAHLLVTLQHDEKKRIENPADGNGRRGSECLQGKEAE